jgi:hypothetical protein
MTSIRMKRSLALVVVALIPLVGGCLITPVGPAPAAAAQPANPCPPGHGEYKNGHWDCGKGGDNGHGQNSQR